MWVLLTPVAYLIGTFPSAVLVARANGIDITTFGSGNPGASNVTRALGWRRGIWVFVLDTLKGGIAAGIGLLIDGRTAGYILGMAALLGHVFPIWKRARGGKGVATGGGIFAVMSPVVFVAMIALWFVVSRITKKASVASLIVVTLLPFAVGIVRSSWWEAFATALICGLVIFRHAPNIKRLLTSNESSIT